MADVDMGTATGGQITTSAGRVKAVVFKARSTNTAPVFVGRSDVSLANGFELTPGEDIIMNFDDGSVAFNTFYTVGAGDVDWVVLLEN